MTAAYSYTTYSTDTWTAVPATQQHVVVCQSCTYSIDIGDAAFCHITLTLVIMRWRSGATRKAFWLAISRLRVQILLEATLRNNLGQVVYTYVPLSPSSITWYRPKGGDALRLGR